MTHRQRRTSRCSDRSAARPASLPTRTAASGCGAHLPTRGLPPAFVRARTRPHDLGPASRAAPALAERQGSQRVLAGPQALPGGVAVLGDRHRAGGGGAGARPGCFSPGARRWGLRVLSAERTRRRLSGLAWLLAAYREACFRRAVNALSSMTLVEATLMCRTNFP